MENHADLLVIFGITGDLARRMTFRALYRLERRGLLDGQVIGVASGDITTSTVASPHRSAAQNGRCTTWRCPRLCSVPSWSTSARPGSCARAGSPSRSRSATTWPRLAS
jgi:hypothetical protein